MQKQCLQLLSMLILLAIVTGISYNFLVNLGITGITLLYLLAVVAAAYFCEFFVACSTVFLAFLAINYFFVEPRYTFEVAQVESWTSLICFLIVSMVITSLVKQLKFQTLQSDIATKQAKFARTLAENLALATDIDQLLLDSCVLLQLEFNKPIAIVQPEPNGNYSMTTKSGLIEMPEISLLNWVSNNGKPISPYTDYWSKSAYWLLPFSRLPSKDPVLVVGNIDNQEISIQTYTAIKSCIDQISQSYHKLINSERARQAEFNAQTEAIQSALLASISHDMRTPLTSILGAATTLQQKSAHLDAAQTAQLVSLIASQARYLATTTENILSLIRLESSTSVQIPMDWQSPEEIIGVVTALYKSRGETIHLQTSFSEPDLLIKANANLLTQALVNLIDNAKQANDNNAPIEFEVTKTNQHINLSVKDHGNGFDEKFNATNIKKFSSTNTKGFGLGLSIVQAIAKYHGAILTINNQEGGGACVTLSFQAPEIESNRE